MLPSAVAAGHPATVAAGIEILEEGGIGGRCGGCGLPRLVRRRDGDDRLAGRRARDLLGRERRLEPRLLRRRALGNGGAAGRAAGPVRRGARPLRGRARAPARSRAFHAGSRRCTRASAGCRGRGSWSPRSARAHGRDDAPRPRRLPRHARAGLHDAAGRGADLRARRAGRSRPASCSTSPGSSAALELAGRRRAGERRTPARSPSSLLGRRGDRRSRAPTWSATRPRWARPVEVAWVGHRFLTRGGLSGVPETLARLPRLARSRRHRARARAARRARRARRRGPHDESRHRRLRRDALRAHVEPRARHGRLPPRARPAAEQHARRGRPRPRAASARRADAEHDGAEPRARTRKGSRSRSARRAGRGCAPRSSASPPASSTRGSSRSAAVERPASTAPATSSTPSPASTSRRWRSSRRRGCTCGAGRPSTTTSAASA